MRRDRNCLSLRHGALDTQAEDIARGTVLAIASLDRTGSFASCLRVAGQEHVKGQCETARISRRFEIGKPH